MSDQMTISPALAEQVLEKLAFSDFPAVTQAGLAALYQAWCRKVPFDNIRKRIDAGSEQRRPLPGATATDFFDHWLRLGTGGTCWAGHGAFYALLRFLEFPVSVGLSTMLSQRPSPAGSPGHGTLLINLEQGSFIVDATMLHGEPLPLREWYSTDPLWGTQVHRSDGYWCVNWKPLGRPRLDCRLLERNAPTSEYPRRHEMSRHNSRFDGALLIRRAESEAIIGIVKGEQVVRSATGTETKMTLSNEEQRKLLIEQFGIAEEIAVMLPDNLVETH